MATATQTKAAKSAPKSKASKVTVQGTVASLVKVGADARKRTADILAAAVAAGLTVASIAKAWKAADDSALGADAISKYVAASVAAKAGADFDATLKALNTNSIARGDVATWAESGDVPEDFRAAKAGEAKAKAGKREGKSPLALTQTECANIVKRVKADKVRAVDALAALVKAHKEVTALAAAAGTLPKREPVKADA